MKITALVITTVVLAFGGLAGCGYSKDHERVSAIYNGQIQTTHGNKVYYYNVVIDECDRGYGLERIVHLKPTKDNTWTNTPSITGHDYAANGNWNRILCGDYYVDSGTNAFFAGYSSVCQQNSGNWAWEPCIFDSERGLKPFTPEQVLFAKMELDQAVAQVRNPTNLVEHTFWVEETRRCVTVKTENVRPAGI